MVSLNKYQVVLKSKTERLGRKEKHLKRTQNSFLNTWMDVF